MHRNTDPLILHGRVRNFCVWVRLPRISTSGGQGMRPVPSHWHWCVPRDTHNLIARAGRQKGAGKHTLIWPLLPLCSREQRDLAPSLLQRKDVQS